MLKKNTGILLKNSFMIISLILLLCTFGCSDKLSGATKVVEITSEVQENETEDDEEIISVCMELYKKASEEGTFADLGMIRNIVKQFGENGYCAVDSKNQIDMTEAERVIKFCEMVGAGEEAEITIIEVNYLGGFFKYEFHTANGEVNVNKRCYKYENENIQMEFTGTYDVENWKYTEEGYLMFSGVLISEEVYALTLNGMEEWVAFRVEPLNEIYRELNRKYLFTVGYERNNMFLVDWSEEDFGQLNFYDVYDIFYPKVNGKSVPYTVDDNVAVGAVYQIPKDEFERVIMAYFNVDSVTLQTMTTYQLESGAYEYKPRGFYEVEYPEYPYPEVVGYTENDDRTISLIVNVVFPYAGDSKVYAHEVIVRPLEDGGVHYVSNRIIPSENNKEQTWHTPRLTREKWEEIYEHTSEACLISNEEQEQLQSKALSAAELVRGMYENLEIQNRGTYTSIPEFTREQRKAVVEELGIKGFVSVSEDVNMENYEAIETFYEEYLNGKDSMVTIIEIQKDGLIGAVTFICHGNQLQAYYVGTGWNEKGISEIKGTSVNNIAEIKLTEKGYLIYAYDTVIALAGLRQYYRIKPLSYDCREMTKKYISGLSYLNYNMLVTNWDSSNVEDILMPCMFEDIYHIYTGEKFKTENWKIPAGQYEQIMMTYFPVSVEQLRQYCGYDANDNCYPYEMIYAKPYPPFGEIVDYTENADGTITLMVDGVWIDYNSDYAFTNKIVVQPFSDGTFRYLSNTIEQKELELPPMVGQENCVMSTRWGVGYNLPINDRERREAKQDCIKKMEYLSNTYKQADIDTNNGVLSDESILEIQNRLGAAGESAYTAVLYSDMKNYEKMEEFLKACMDGKCGSIVVYKILPHGGIRREKYIFDGTEMYVLNANAIWDEKNNAEVTYVSYTKIQEWRYSDKGWFCYQLCVPEYPDVAEIVDGSCIIRVKPMSNESRAMSEKCVQRLGYQGNNILCSNWDAENLDKLDYNGLYEYLYEMKYQRKLNSEDYPNGIPKTEFECLIMEYLPISTQQIQKYAVFNEENQTYAWAPLGCFNYAPTFFGTSFPEVTDIKENADGTVTLRVDAVCRMVVCDDAVITHELTVQFAEDGSFKYLGNKILNDGSRDIPRYRYRFNPNF